MNPSFLDPVSCGILSLLPLVLGQLSHRGIWMTVVEIAVQAMSSIDHIGAMAQAATSDVSQHTSSALSNLGSADLEDQIGGESLCTHIFNF